MKDRMKDQVEREITKAETAATQEEAPRGSRSNGETVWLAPGSPRSMEPLLSGLGIELLGPREGDRATIRVEAIAASGGVGHSVDGLRVARVAGSAHDTVEFEGPAVYAAASCVISHALGLIPPLLTADSAMFAVIRAGARSGQVDSPTLVTGETGTGKELLVRLIHAASGRAGGMASVNCAALNDPAPPFASAANKGASHNAGRGAAPGDHRLDELCAAGDTTLFLDQVSELSSASQARVLYSILRSANNEAGERMASEVRPGARLISASNRPLGPLLLSGDFKRDLYARLAVLTLAVPPLRERRADIALLASGFLRTLAPQLSFTAGALQALSNYPFQGNVRELQNLVTRLAIVPRDNAGHLIDAADARAQFAVPVLSASMWKTSPFQMRREMVIQALMICGGDRVEAARKLGISVRALQQHVLPTPASASRSR